MKEQVRCVNVCTRLVLSWYRYAQVKICTCTKLMCYAIVHNAPIEYRCTGLVGAGRLRKCGSGGYENSAASDIIGY